MCDREKVLKGADEDDVVDSKRRENEATCSDETTSTSTFDTDDDEHVEIDDKNAQTSSETSTASSTTRHDYRLHRKETEGAVLAAVPEESANTMHDSSPVKSTSTVVGPPDTESNQGAAHFQIPSSDMSEAGYSESSLQSERFLNGGQILTKTEALTAKQQVALWLTRTSMSDLSSMPSLRSLVHTQSTPTDKSPRISFKNIIQRNHSAKSLAGSIGYEKSGKLDPDFLDPGETDKMMSTPIRKCETVIALSGMGPKGCTGGSCTASACHSRAPTPSTVAAGEGRTHPLLCNSASTSCAGSRKNSSFNLFARLSQENRSGRRPQLHQTNSYAGTTTPHARSVVSEAIGSGCESPFPGIRPFNRLRSNSSMMCSRCTSILSVNASRMTSRATSQLSIFPVNRRLSAAIVNETKEPEILCKICLHEYPLKETSKIQNCGCVFCKECMGQYVTFEVMSGSYDISCPDPDCDVQGVLQLGEIENLAGKDVFEKHKRFRLNTEVALDKNRAWCPQVGCETVCHICSSASISGPVEVQCPSCQKAFCSMCSASWHAGKTCEEHGKSLVKRAGTSASLSGMFNAGNDSVLIIGGIEIKRCPMCSVPIERDTGCAQMMCKRCKHVFCWYCLKSLDDDFLLRHYDSGACKGQLGHSRASVLWHRVQVIGIFAAFGLLLVLASPCLLVAAPCLLCCGYKTCKNSGDGEKADNNIEASPQNRD